VFGRFAPEVVAQLIAPEARAFVGEVTRLGAAAGGFVFETVAGAVAAKDAWS